LRATIESFMLGHDGPARVEFGPLYKVARTLRERYATTGRMLAYALVEGGWSLRLAAEVQIDMDAPAETPVNATLPVTMEEVAA
jgi:hypothetical protein